MTRTISRERAALMAVLIATGACYRYQPVAETAPALGGAVRVSLTPEGTTQIASRLGPRIVQLEGRIAQVHADTVVLKVTTARSADLVESYFDGDTVSLPRGAVSAMEQRKLAVGPTAVVGGMLVGGAVLGATALGGDNGNGTRPPGGGPATQQ